mgnify:FL=1
MNGFKDNVWKEIDKIEIVELVLEDFGTMLCVNRFKGVKSLTLINVGISSIEVAGSVTVGTFGGYPLGRDVAKREYNR